MSLANLLLEPFHPRSVKRAARLLAVVALLAWVPMASADDLLDQGHTLLARQTLLKDQLLAPLNLGVRVRDGVAVLWGPVPSRELGERATACLRRLPELREVRNELFVDPLAEAATLLATPPLRPGLPSLQAILAAQAPSPPRPPKTAPEWLPVKQTTGPTPVLPVAVSKPPVPPEPKLAPPILPPPPTDLLEAARRIQQGEERFRRITIQVQGSTVYLGGVAYRWQDIHDLSRTIARIPGVEHVVLRGIRAER